MDANFGTTLGNTIRNFFAITLAVTAILFLIGLALATTVLCLLLPQITVPLIITAAVIATAAILTVAALSGFTQRVMSAVFNFGSSSSQNGNASAHTNHISHAHNNSTKHMHAAFGTTASAANIPTPPAAATMHSHRPLNRDGMWTMPTHISFENENNDSSAFTPS